jgi:hypothetical protein
MEAGQGLTTSAANFHNAAIVDGEVTLCAISAVAIETKEAANRGSLQGKWSESQIGG